MKKLLIILVSFIYLMQISFIVSICFVFTSDALIQENQNAKLFFIIGIIFAFLIVILCILVFIFGAINLSYKRLTSYSFIMIIKLILIPFYIVNFIIWFLLIAGSLNPWLLPSIFITIPLSLGFTYMIMITTSYNMIIRLLHDIKTKQIEIKDYLMLAVFLFIFILDTIASVIITYRVSKQKSIYIK